jgi:hypothetical protein
MDRLTAGLTAFGDSASGDGKMNRRRQSWIVSVIAFSVAPPLTAQELPSAEVLIERYVEAIGGRDAHLAPTSMRQTGRVSIMEMGLEGTFEIVASAENRFRMAISIPGLGEILTGYDGETGWTTNPLIGPAIMQGAELATARDNASWRATLRDSDLIPVRETVEAATFEGESCWKVRLEWASGRESFDCYSQGTGLLVATEEVQISPMGSLPVTMVYGDYRDVQGMRIPGRLTQSGAGQTLVISIDSIELNAVEAAAFEVPATVRALVGPSGGN